MIAKLLLQNSLYVVAMGVLLFASAGTLAWPSAWVFLATSAIIGPAAGLWLARVDPALLEERLRSPVQKDQPVADKKFVLAFGLTVLAWFVAMGIPRKLVRGARGQGAIRPRPSRGVDRPLRLGAPSDV